MKLLSLLIFTLLTSCATVGGLGDEGYVNNSIGYSLKYEDGKKKLFLPKSWKNQSLDTKGQLKRGYKSTQSRSVKSLSGKKQTLKFNRIDLEFRHLITNGTITVQSFPLEEQYAQKKMEILVKNFVSNLSGNFSVAASLNTDLAIARSKNWVTKIVSSKASTLDDAEYFESIIEVADSDQLLLDSNHRDAKYKLVIIRPSEKKAYINTKSVKINDKWIERVEFFPGIIAVVYAMDYAYFDEYLAEFDGLLKRISLIEPDARI